MNLEDVLLPLLRPVGLAGVSVLYALALAALGGYWLWRVAGEARRGRAPLAAAWAAIPALLALLLARSIEVPALFGIGLTLLLVSEYWPHSYAPRYRRPTPTWFFLSLLSALGLLGVLAAGNFSLALLLTALGSWLFGTAGLLTSTLWPRRYSAKLPQGLAFRMQRAKVPEWPEFALTLTSQGAQLTNTSPHPLKVVGWSPRSINAWLPALDDEGQKVETLQSGQSAFLPLTAYESGLRVWYTESAATRLEPRLFKADWTPSSQGSRTLN